LERRKEGQFPKKGLRNQPLRVIIWPLIRGKGLKLEVFGKPRIWVRKGN